jgi:hypothetical protein
LLAFLDLNCLVRGEDRNDIFTIKIAQSESVSTLQQNIKAVRGLKMDTLPMLWKVLSLDQVGDIDADRRWQVNFSINDEVINMRDLSTPIKASTSWLSTMARNTPSMLKIPCDGPARRLRRRRGC